MNDFFFSLECGCISVWLNWSDAIDITDYHIVCRLERSDGLIGQAILWFKSYLSDRHQFVRVNNESLDYVGVNFTVLGPFLFSLYMDGPKFPLIEFK